MGAPARSPRRPTPWSLPRVIPGVVLAVVALGCKGYSTDEPGGNSTPLLTIPADAPTNESPCEDRLGFARQALSTLVVAANGSCSTDGECTIVFAQTQCEGGCQAPILTKLHHEFEVGQGAIDQRVCTGYVEAGCAYATPSCLAVEARCQAGRCALVDVSD